MTPAGTARYSSRLLEGLDAAEGGCLALVTHSKLSGFGLVTLQMTPPHEARSTPLSLPEVLSVLRIAPRGSLGTGPASSVGQQQTFRFSPWPVAPKDSSQRTVWDPKIVLGAVGFARAPFFGVTRQGSTRQAFCFARAERRSLRWRAAELRAPISYQENHMLS